MADVTAIRNPVQFPGTVCAVDAALSESEQWDREREKRRIEHERDRQRWIDNGGALGPITYSETRGESWKDWRGEWRSQIGLPAWPVAGNDERDFSAETP